MSSSTFRKLKRISEREREGERKPGGRGSAKKKGRMGNQKQKWTSEEEDALLAGVAKHGAGKWKNILKDQEFAPSLILRSNIDLKDKWRNLSSSITSAQVTQEKMKNPMIKKSVRYAAPSLSLPTRTPPDATVMDDSKTQERRYNSLIFEALSTMKDPKGSDVGAIHNFIQQRIEEPIPHNFKRLLAGRLRSLVSLGKLEKTENGFKIKNVPLLEIKTPSGLATSSETEDDAVHITAYTVADAENKSFLAAEAVKEAERVSKIAEETECMLLLVKEINEQCSHGEVVRLA